MRPFASRPGEYTSVSDETERGIPLRTWLTSIAVSAADVVALLLCGVMIHRLLWNLAHPRRVYAYGWWGTVLPFLLTWWPTVPILVCLSVIVWSVPLFYRFLLETMLKNWPMYDAAKAENGAWHPFVGWWRRRHERAALRHAYRAKFGRNWKAGDD